MRKSYSMKTFLMWIILILCPASGVAQELKPVQLPNPQTDIGRLTSPRFCTIPPILAGQRDDVSCQRIFVRPNQRHVTLRAAPLLQHTTRLPLAHPVLSARMFHGAPASLRA